MKSNLSPIKERIDPNDLPETIVNSSYPKPRWMLNESINDKTWYLSKVGINLSFYKENINKAQKFEFKQRIADHEYLTDKINDEPYRVCRRVNILRDYPDDKIKIYP
ncbi:MAG: hypothetical protein CL492_08480 [Acinetobacter sp.]|nr:hypothetical protein [Acinetobacter sp.]MBT50138.1 hypothetical protein [Acinetobacter sp.]